MPKGFQKGNKGRPKGAKGKKASQWEVLGNYIEEELAEDIMKTLQTLMRSPDIKTKIIGVELSNCPCRCDLSTHHCPC